MTWAEGTSLEFVNSAGNSAIARVDLGTLSLAASESKPHGLSFKTNADVTGSSFSAAQNTSKVPAISVSNNSVVNYRVTTSSFNDRALISVDQGSTLNVYKKLDVDKFGIDFKVGGTFNYYENLITLGNANITGTFNAKQIEFKAGTSKLSGNAVINTEGPVYIDGTTLTISDNATVKLTKETGSVESKIILNSSGNLTIAAKNAISYEDGLADIRVSGARQAASLTISADNKFNNLIFNRQDYNEYLNLSVIDGAKLFFNAIAFDSTSKNANLKITKFSEFSIFFKDISGWDVLASVALSDTEGNEYRKDELKWIAGKYDGVDGYWLSTVPEPATYAAVFGAFALALAIYRRRK